MRSKDEVKKEIQNIFEKSRKNAIFVSVSYIKRMVRTDFYTAKDIVEKMSNKGELIKLRTTSGPVYIKR